MGEGVMGKDMGHFIVEELREDGMYHDLDIEIPTPRSQTLHQLFFGYGRGLSFPMLTEDRWYSKEDLKTSKWLNELDKYQDPNYEHFENNVTCIMIRGVDLTSYDWDTPFTDEDGSFTTVRKDLEWWMPYIQKVIDLVKSGSNIRIWTNID